MYFHVMFGAKDLEASKRFYDALLGTLGIPSNGKLRETPPAYMYGDPKTGLFLITEPQDGNEATHANGGTVMFNAASADVVKAWYDAGLANGGTDVSGPPAAGGLPNSFAAYLRDPSGNKVAVIAFG